MKSSNPKFHDQGEFYYLLLFIPVRISDYYHYLIRENAFLKCQNKSIFTKSFFVLIFLLVSSFTYSQTIGTVSVSNTPGLPNSTVDISFLVTNGNGSPRYFTTGTTYSIYLSNSSVGAYALKATFTSSTAPGSSNGASATIAYSFTIPSGTPSGLGYKISVGSSNPGFTASGGENASVGFEINNLTITLGTFPTICLNTTNAYLPYSATTGSPASLSIDFDAAANSAGFTDFTGSGLPASPININVPYGVASGTYNALLRVGTYGPVYTSRPYSFSITVNSAAAISYYFARTTCNGTGFSFTPVNGTDGTVPAGTTYSWAAPAGTGFTGGASGSGASSISGTLTNTTTGTVTATYTVTPVTGTCTGNNFTVDVIIQSSVTAGTIGTAQSICSGATPAALTSITNGSGSGTISYEWQTNASGSYVTIGSATSPGYQPPALAATTSYRRRTKSVQNGVSCYSGYTTPITITITSVNTATLSSAAGTDAQTKCINTAITNITYSTTGATGAIVTGLPAGVTGSWATNTVTISGITTASGTSNYTVTLIGGCGTITSTGTITVSANPSAPATTGALVCIGSTATLSASGAVAGQFYKWYNAATAGALLKTSTDNIDNTYTTTAIAATTDYWVSILSAGGCESTRTKVTATFPAISPDSQTSSGANTWIGHVYDGTNNAVAYNGSFTNYYGNYTEPLETIDQSFGGDNNCFSINSSLGSRNIYTATFSVRYRMTSSRNGLYTVGLGSDDGSRLTVDGTLVYNNWNDQGFGNRNNVLISLNGNSSLVYDYYENGGGNRVVFQNLTTLLLNNLTTNTTQNICMGSLGGTISGDVFGTLPAGITLSGTGYQWAYSSFATGPWTDLAGETGATFTPNTANSPFSTSGKYYVVRKAILSSTNNVLINPYEATSISNYATIDVDGSVLQGSLSANGPFCDSGAGQLTWTATSGTGPYTVIYNDGTSDQTQLNVTSGIPFNVFTNPVTSTTVYTLVSVSGASGCSRYGGFTNPSVTIDVNFSPQGSITSNGPFCGTGAGQLTWTETSGTGPYTIIYNDGTADQTATNVSSGIAFDVANTPVTSTTTYSLVSVSGAGSCARTSGFSGATATIQVNPKPIAPTIGTITQPTCADATVSVVLNGLPSGIWTLTRTPGGISTPGSGTSTTITGLSAGTYSYIVTNENTTGLCPGTGTGLLAQYFNNMTLTGTPDLVRTDATVDFNWGNSSPDGTIAADNFSVKWTGKVQPCFSENYTFTTRSDDGVRLWVNGVSIIDNWTNHGPVDNTGSIDLVAGLKYELVLEYYENTGGSVAQLSWNSPGQVLEIIPQSQLYSSEMDCSSSASANIVIDAQPTVPAAPTAGTSIQPTCTVATGTIEVTAPIGAYEYNIDGGTYQSSTTFSGIASGSHNLTVRRSGDITCISGPTSVTVDPQPAQPAAPVITTSGTTTFCSGGSVTLTSSAGTGYLWSNGETTQSIEVSISGDYTVQITNASGCQSSSSAITTVTVNPNPSPTLITPVTETCPNSTGVSYTTQAGYSTYTWSVSGGTILGVQGTNSVTIDWGAGPAGTVGVLVTDPNGCSGSISENVTIADTTDPVISGCPSNISQNVDIGYCSALVTIPAPTSVSDNCGGIPSLSWAGGAGVTVVDATHATVAVGTSTITYTATDAAGNTSSCNFTVTVVDNVDPTISCPANVSVDGYANIPAMMTRADFDTDISDNCSIDDNSLVVTDVYSSNCYTGQPLVITRTYTISDSNGRSASCSQTITVNNVSILIDSADLTACSSKSATLTSVVSGFSPANYQWETSTDGGFVWNPVSGETNASFVVSTPVNGDKFRLKVSTGSANQECYSNILTLVADTSIPQFPVTASKYSGGVVLCDKTGPTTIPDLITALDAIDNCTDLAGLRTTYTITLPDNSTVSGTDANVSVLNAYAFPVGTSIVEMDIADETGNRSGVLTFEVKIGAVISLSAITTDGVPATDDSGYRPYQGSSHNYSVTDESGFSFTWTVNKETSSGSGVFTNDITSGLNITGLGTSVAGITWGASSMPANYRITVTKKNNSTNCEVSTMLDITVLNNFNPKVLNFGDACHGISGTTVIDWVVDTKPNLFVAPEWNFNWNIYTVVGTVETLVDSGTELGITSDSKTISYSVAVGDGSEKNYRFRISGVTDSLGNPETLTSDDTDDVKIFTKPTIGF